MAWTCSGSSSNELTQNLIEQGQLKTPSIINAFRHVDRGLFLPDSLRSEAYIDAPVRHETYHQSAPHMYAHSLEFLDVRPGMAVFNIGSGTGYLTTIMGILAGQAGVNHAMEVHPQNVSFSRSAVSNFIDSIDTRSIDLAAGFALPLLEQGNFYSIDPATHRQYDRVYCGAACEPSKLHLIEGLLLPGGQAIVPSGHHLVLIRRKPKPPPRQDAPMATEPDNQTPVATSGKDSQGERRSSTGGSSDDDENGGEEGESDEDEDEEDEENSPGRLMLRRGEFRYYSVTQVMFAELVPPDEDSEEQPFVQKRVPKLAEMARLVIQQQCSHINSWSSFLASVAVPRNVKIYLNNNLPLPFAAVKHKYPDSPSQLSPAEARAAMAEIFDVAQQLMDKRRFFAAYGEFERAKSYAERSKEDSAEPSSSSSAAADEILRNAELQALKCLAHHSTENEPAVRERCKALRERFPDAPAPWHGDVLLLQANCTRDNEALLDQIMKLCPDMEGQVEERRAEARRGVGPMRDPQFLMLMRILGAMNRPEDIQRLFEEGDADDEDDDDDDDDDDDGD